MKQHGVKSASQQAMAKQAPAKTCVPLTPPSDLTDEERALFNEIVSDCHPEHFVRGDKALLANFVRASVTCMHAARDPAQVDVWAKMTKVQARLAVSLRLGPSARNRRYRAAKMAAEVTERQAVATPWSYVATPS